MPEQDEITDASVPLRPPNIWTVPDFALTSISSNPSHIINFRHPSYTSHQDSNILITLQAYDHPDGGLHHETARIACAIIANNAWDGYFSHTPGGPRLGLGPNQVLSVGKEYFFHVPHPIFGDEDADSQESLPPYGYPVCPSFEHWVFPHRNLPQSWHMSRTPSAPPAPPASSSFEPAIPQQNSSCRMTNSRDGMKYAQICPREEAVWFQNNRMEQYNSNGYLSFDSITNDLCNTIALRADLHSVFSRRIFTFVPKSTAQSTSFGSGFVAHVMQQTSEIGLLYHNAHIQSISDVRVEFLLARFAWTIFPLLTPFLVCGRERLLLLVEDDRVVERVVSPEGCYLIAGNLKLPRAHCRIPEKHDVRNAQIGPAGGNAQIEPAERYTERESVERYLEDEPAGRCSEIGPAERYSDIDPAEGCTDIEPVGRYFDPETESDGDRYKRPHSATPSDKGKREDHSRKRQRSSVATGANNIPITKTVAWPHHSG